MIGMQFKRRAQPTLTVLGNRIGIRSTHKSEAKCRSDGDPSGLHGSCPDGGQITTSPRRATFPWSFTCFIGTVMSTKPVTTGMPKMSTSTAKRCRRGRDGWIKAETKQPASIRPDGATGTREPSAPLASYCPSPPALLLPRRAAYGSLPASSHPARLPEASEHRNTRVCAMPLPITASSRSRARGRAGYTLPHVHPLTHPASPPLS